MGRRHPADLRLGEGERVPHPQRHHPAPPARQAAETGVEDLPRPSDARAAGRVDAHRDRARRQACRRNADIGALRQEPGSTDGPQLVVRTLSQPVDTIRRLGACLPRLTDLLGQQEPVAGRRGQSSVQPFRRECLSCAPTYLYPWLRQSEDADPKCADGCRHGDEGRKQRCDGRGGRRGRSDGIQADDGCQGDGGTGRRG